jgi:hypothetical protein
VSGCGQYLAEPVIRKDDYFDGIDKLVLWGLSDFTRALRLDLSRSAEGAVTRLAPLLYDELAALVWAEVERPRRFGLGGLTARRLHVSEDLAARISEARHEREAAARGFALDGLRGRDDMVRS